MSTTRVILAGKPRIVGGWHKPRNQVRRMLGEPPTGAVLIRSDLRNITAPILNQGEVGACTAHTELETREFLILREVFGDTGSPDDSTKEAALAAHGARFSRLYQYARTRQREGTPLAEDSGASVADSFAIGEDKGSCPVTLWSDADPETRFTLDPDPSTDIEAAKHKVVLGFGLPSLTAIRASLSEGFPVGFGFTVPANMMTDQCATDGIVHLPATGEASDGGHAVTAVGHDDTIQIDGVAGVLICQNHWGEDWGQKGFFLLPYGFFELDLASDAHTNRRATEV